MCSYGGFDDHAFMLGYWPRLRCIWDVSCAGYMARSFLPFLHSDSFPQGTDVLTIHHSEIPGVYCTLRSVRTTAISQHDEVEAGLGSFNVDYCSPAIDTALLSDGKALTHHFMLGQRRMKCPQDVRCTKASTLALPSCFTS